MERRSGFQRHAWGGLEIKIVTRARGLVACEARLESALTSNHRKSGMATGSRPMYNRLFGVVARRVEAADRGGRRRRGTRRP